MQKLWSPWRSQYIDSFQDENKNECVFCNIIKSNDDISNLILERGKNFSLIMNKYPYNSGHLMVISNCHIGDINDLEEKQKGEFLSYVGKC